MKNILIALVCFWRTCSILDSELGACSNAGSGSESQMLASEVITRGPSKIFLRECVDQGAGEKPGLNWAIGGKVIPRGKVKGDGR